ncbi:C3H1-type domain-containing protein [Entamoeba marina]
MSVKRKSPQHKQYDVDRFRLLQSKTIIQRNLVYITNVAHNIVDHLTISQIADTLRKYEFFGQYGEITKIIPNIKTLHNLQSATGPSFSVYVTYKTTENAIQCIRSTNGGWLAGKVLNSSLGTTKYLSEKDYITKEELSAGKNRIHDTFSQHVSIDSEGNNYLPPLFTNIPIEVDMDSFETENPTLIKLLNRYKKVYTRDVNPHSPVHSSLAPLKLFKFDLNISTIIKYPVYVFFLYNTRTSDIPSVEYPKEWKIEKNGSPPLVSSPSIQKKIKNNELDNNSEEQIENEMKLIDSSNDESEDISNTKENVSVGVIGDSDNLFSSLISQDYLNTFRTLSQSYSNNTMKSLCSCSYAIHEEEIITEMDEIPFFVDNLLNEEISNEQNENESSKENSEDNENNEEKNSSTKPVIVQEMDEWTTVEKGMSLKKAKQNKPTKKKVKYVEEVEERVEGTNKEYIKHEEPKPKESKKEHIKKTIANEEKKEEKKIEKHNEKRKEIINEKRSKKTDENIEKDEKKDERSQSNHPPQIPKSIEIPVANKAPSKPPPCRQKVITDSLEILELKINEIKAKIDSAMELAEKKHSILHDHGVILSTFTCQYPDSYFLIDH